MKKSIGVIILGYFYIIGTIILWFFIVFIRGRNILTPVFIMMFTIYSIVVITSAIGILLLKNWGRLAIIVLNLIKAGEMGYKFVRAILQNNAITIEGFFNYMPTLIICLAIVWFLSKDSTKKLFL